MIDGISGGPARGPLLRAGTPQARDVTGAGVAASPARPAAPRAAAGLVADLAKAPPVNETRVAALRAVIADGRYAIDPDRIAGAMLALERGRP